MSIGHWALITIKPTKSSEFPTPTPLYPYTPTPLCDVEKNSEMMLIF
ncbi:hypothetical protein [Nostoc sp. CMAA1605]|nr:hypothetical protein [Nostoc sp. CMAA1605]